MTTPTYNWEIVEYGTEPSPDLISELYLTSISWKCTASTVKDGVTVYSDPANGNFPLSPVDPDNYVPYTSLTKTELVSWIEQTLQSQRTPSLAPEGQTISMLEYIKKCCDMSLENKLNAPPEPEEA